MRKAKSDVRETTVRVQRRRLKSYEPIDKPRSDFAALATTLCSGERRA
jgi:hypothetical protein